MIEDDVESYLTSEIKKQGGEIRKLAWLGRKGAPDRLVFFRGVHFVELKRPGRKADPHQAREHRRMVKHGANVYVIDTKEKVDEFIKAIKCVRSQGKLNTKVS